MVAKNLFWMCLVVLFVPGCVTTIATGGFGTPDDFASWIGDEKGGLWFPVYNQEVYDINPNIDLNEVCESTLEESVDGNFRQVDNSSCQYNSETKKIICKRIIDYEFIKNVRTMTSLVVAGYYRGQNTTTCPQASLLEEDQQAGTIPDDMWKIVAEIFPKDMGLSLTISANLVPNEAYNGVTISGNAFCNEIHLGWEFKGDVMGDLKRGRMQGMASTIETDRWSIEVNSSRLNETATAQLWKLEGTVNIKDIPSTLNFEGSVEMKLNPNTVAWRVQGSVKVKGTLLVYNIDTTVASINIEEITIPRSAFSELSIKHIFFKDSYFLRDFDKDAFQDLRTTETITFENSKLEEIPRLDYLLAYLTNLKALYIRRTATPNLNLGQEEILPNLELLSFEGSGPLQLSNSSFQFLNNSLLKYLNFQDCNLKLIRESGPILSQVQDTLEYLDLSYTSLSDEVDLSLMLDGLQITHLSLAGLYLENTPKEALSLVKDTITYLTFKGNNFQKIPDENMFYIGLDFPLMPNLKELDLRNCDINYIDKGSFDMLPGLQKLYLSHNKIENLQDGWSEISPPLSYLDLSYNGVTDGADSATTLSLMVILSLKSFTNLTTLDLSNGVFTDVETLVAELPNTLTALSIANTGLQNMTDNLFVNKNNLRVLDLSNNPQMIISTSTIQIFQYLDSLKYLHLKNCRISDLFFIDLENAVNNNTGFVLQNLEYADLSFNNIKMVDPAYFRYFPSLKKVDLSSNSITDWADSLMTNGSKLESIYIDDNKIATLTDLMLEDIYRLRTVRLGNNPFVCGCFVSELTKKLGGPNEGFICDINRQGLLREFRVLPKRHHNGFFVARREFLKPRTLERRHDTDTRNDMEIMEDIQERLMRSLGVECINNVEPAQNSTHLLEYCVHFLDWGDDVYQCFSDHTKAMPFQEYNETDECINDEFEEFQNNFISFLYIGAGIIVFLGAIVGLFYWKWWDIRLITRAVKEAAMMTLLDKENYDPPPFQYNVFVSYSDKDRTWVLDHLLPTLESWNDLKVCLHERDFQVGLGILENIISSIDRSQAIILVLSQAFVRSQWCQFEMHLAQHRLLETRRDQLILILLEQIPRISRPKTLQYLMRTKTYVEWPGSTAAMQDRRNEFWSRIFKALSRSHCAIQPA